MLHVSQFARLETLTLNATESTAEGISHLQKLPALKTLGLIDLNPTPDIMEQLQELTNLETLIITTSLNSQERNVMSAALKEALSNTKVEVF